MTKRLAFLFALILLTTLPSLAQIRAITEDGRSVILFRDGTWQYDRGQNPWENHPNNPFWQQPSEFNVDPGATGKSVDIVIKEELVFQLRDGLLTDFLILDKRGNIIYSMSKGVQSLPFDWRVQYELGSDRVSSVGPYKLEYEFHTDRIENIGGYKIQYSFFDNRVEQIGNLAIKYDFHTDRITQIGKFKIEYNFFNNQVEKISGTNPGVILYFTK